LLYHPDHGQDVCHNDNFSGHNHKANEQWDIPMIFWSPKISQIDKNITNSKYQLDNVDNTILGLLEINGKYYDKRFDLFSD
jgi:glucan phosphoethanolaminetransferase (alkaline phosphatase superfamily)